MSNKFAFVDKKPLEEKRCWHSCRLQTLQPRKFADAVQKIIQGQHSLVAPRRADNTSA